MTLYVDKVSYDGISTSNDSSISYQNNVTPSGSYWGYTTILSPSDSGYKIEGSYYSSSTPGQGRTVENFGNSQVSTGQAVYLSRYDASSNTTIAKVQILYLNGIQQHSNMINRELHFLIYGQQKMGVIF